MEPPPIDEGKCQILALQQHATCQTHPGQSVGGSSLDAMQQKIAKPLSYCLEAGHRFTLAIYVGQGVRLQRCTNHVCACCY